MGALLILNTEYTSGKSVNLLLIFSTSFNSKLSISELLLIAITKLFFVGKRS